ncbi:uncharacterized protein DEA37_0003549 [Paragonimus westermani]|uniref:Uncharacterized protein n=1 Tax=Paragonimus westermani TaxID=34504 RepID=A0A5J4NTF6_9TREM|nr:uncharacterized protein DEA37_0003549 [Paragonimus westermani]
MFLGFLLSFHTAERVQISEKTREKLEEYKVYKMTLKGTAQCKLISFCGNECDYLYIFFLKDGGTIQTFWLDGRPEEADCRQTAKLIAQMNKEREKLADLNLSTQQQTTGEGWESVTASRVSSARSQASKRASMIQSRRASIVRGSIAGEVKRKGQKH